MHSVAAVDHSLTLSAQTVSGITIAELTGELDAAHAPAVREQFLRLLSAGSSRLVVDLSQVTVADASGLAVLVSAARRARLLGGYVRLAAVSRSAEQVLHITGLHRSFAIFPTVPAAALGLPRAPRGNPVAAASALA